MNKRLDYWDNIKGIMIILVVIGHLIEKFRGNFDTFPYFYVFIYLFHMPVFIILNGYFAKRSKKSPNERAFKMLKVFLIVQIIVTVLREIIEKQPITVSLGNIAPSCWYLLFLVYVYLLMNLFKDKDKNKWIIFSVILSIIIGLDKNCGYEFALAKSIYYLPFFIIGYYFDFNKIVNYIKKYKIVFITGFILFESITLYLFSKKIITTGEILGYSSYQGLIGINTIKGILVRIYLYIASLITSLGILSIIPKFKTIFSNIGKYTLTIYIVHVSVITLTFYTLNRWINLNSNKLKFIIISSIIIIITLLISLLYIKYKNNKHNESLAGLTIN